MAGSWNLRQLFAKKAIERERNAEQRVYSTQIIEVGDFRVEVGERVVTLRGEELTLMAEEFDVLLYLIGHPQRCVTPRTVLATSWTSDGLHQTEFLRHC
jgi:DNA-binding response OmpR family regulator